MPAMTLLHSNQRIILQSFYIFFIVILVGVVEEVLVQAQAQAKNSAAFFYEARSASNNGDTEYPDPNILMVTNEMNILNNNLHDDNWVHHSSMRKMGSIWDPTVNCDEMEISAASRPRKHYHSLVCWLYNLNVSIPDESFRKGIISVSISEMTCTKFQVNRTESAYSPSNSDSNEIDDPTLDVKVFGISATCTGLYHSGLTGGTVTVLIESIPVEMNHVSRVSNHEEVHVSSLPLHLKTSIGSTNIQITNMTRVSQVRAPSSGELRTCATNIEVPEHNGISFSGSFSARFVEIFAKSIASHVTGALNSQVCPSLKKMVDRKLTSLLEQLDKVLVDILNGGIEQDTSGLEPLQHKAKDEADLMQWREVLLLRDILIQGSILANRYLDRGIIIDTMERIGWPDMKDKGEESCIDCGYFFRGINGLFRNLTKGSASAIIRLDRKIEYNIQSFGKVTLFIRNITIGGLDTFTELGLVPTQAHAIDARVLMNELTVTLDTDLVIYLVGGEELNESFALSLNTSDLLLDADLDFGILRDAFRDVTFKDFQAAPSAFCDPWRKLLHTLSYAYLPALLINLSVDSIQVRPLHTQTDAMEASLDGTVNDIFELILTEYKMLVTKVLGAFSNGSGRDLLNKFLHRMLESYNKTGNDESCMGAFQMSQTRQDFFKFNESIVLSRVHDFFLKENVISRFNEFSSCVTSYLSTSSIEQEDVDRIRDDFGIKFTLDNIFLADVGLNSIALNPIDDSHLMVGMSANTNHYPTNASVALQYPAEELHISCNTSSKFSGLRAEGGLKLHFDITDFYHLHIYDVFRCPLSMMGPVSISSGVYSFGGVVDELNFDLNMVVAKKGEQKEISYRNEDGYTRGVLSSFFLTSSRVAQNIMNGVRYIYLSLGSSCLSIEDLNEDESSRDRLDEVFINIESAFFWAAVSIIIFNMVFFVTRPHLNVGQIHSSRIVDNDGTPSSLIFHHKITNGKRLFIPLMIIGSIAVFMASNLSTGASVDIQISRSDGSVILFVPSATTFSLAKTVRDMYHAQVYTLMSLVLIFSGIWPYIKLLLMGISWLIPLTFCSLERREYILVWLDALGKYSLVDSFVLVLMLVSFKFHIQLVDIGTIDSFVIPDFGFYLFLGATIASLVIGHVVTFFHRYTILPDTMQERGIKLSLGQHTFFVETDHAPRPFKFSNISHILWTLTTLTCYILIAVGVVQKSFIFEFEGLLGTILGDDRKTSYSLLTLGTSIPISVENPQGMGIVVIQYAYFFFALFMPFVCLFTVTILYYIPLSIRQQQVVFMLAEIANAWSAIEVFLLSVLASMLELSQFAQFMVGDHCDFLKGKFFQELFENEGTCFNVKSTVHKDVTFLFLGVVLYFFIVFTGLRLARVVLEDRIRCSNGQEVTHFRYSNNTKSGKFIDYLIRWNLVILLDEEVIERECLYDFTNDLSVTF